MTRVFASLAMAFTFAMSLLASTAWVTEAG